MSHSPKVLAPGERERVIENLRTVRARQIVRGNILEIEGRYLLSELKNMARANRISHLGDKEQLCRRLVAAGVIK